MSGSTEYQIVAGRDAGDLSKKVNKRIGEGWHLYGSPFELGGSPCQAMVKGEFKTEPEVRVARIRKNSDD